MGEPDPVTGRFPRYVYPKWFRDEIQAHGRVAADDAPRARGVAQTRFLRRAMAEWDGDTSLDLQQFFGIDLLDEAVLRRPWWWLRARVLGLLDIHDARLTRWAMEVSA